MILFWAFNSFSVYSEDEPKFLIIHLDVLSSPNFFQHLKEDYFPNREAIFEEKGGHIIPYLRIKFIPWKD